MVLTAGALSVVRLGRNPERRTGSAVQPEPTFTLTIPDQHEASHAFCTNRGMSTNAVNASAEAAANRFPWRRPRDAHAARGTRGAGHIPPPDFGD